MLIEQHIRRKIPGEEFDYQALLDALSDYSRPRDKITDLMKKGVIIRVKKGLYIFGPDYAQRPYSRELLANLVYGPSYVSLDYALSYYGMIPERVEVLTSVTCAKNRAFQTPIGRFTYWSVPLVYYQVGIDIAEAGDNRLFLIATREKALADRIYHDRGAPIRKVDDLEPYLMDHLRVDPALLDQLNAERVAEIAGRVRSRKLSLLSKFVRTRAGDTVS